LTASFQLRARLLTERHAARQPQEVTFSGLGVITAIDVARSRDDEWRAALRGSAHASLLGVVDIA